MTTVIDNVALFILRLSGRNLTVAISVSFNGSVLLAGIRCGCFNGSFISRRISGSRLGRGIFLIFILIIGLRILRSRGVRCTIRLFGTLSVIIAVIA